ncbi:MAG: hypothetical protein UV61_C0002G0080 [Candidatus Gottesmanbacteria bacterium GW2011_GWB1_43_11]|uniref:Cohesin domain-containing protein n=1 Tax=Candidatus Gottesmanbacteria bacterium GW2011_GWB1_43_11 TaxID=1618446 RepID=A0A0G1CP81_9BACT|nr:MAG: hypothetical protein UV04_C0040G0009 [Candidatus Gottesmanbacteria bacterium GW2011_GWA2_42_16]KKS52108.1 MAG: hypothetical protein UV17_C0051G0013 [Candidatus Gottesmanbacteria bacterium GW2011_GWA1_42_26]KKS81834.1 MAG: hypothetical protein UV55_C0008G0049 [Candidatus Gottesmanbacteria bacterium GW2011_GWC1_43_10]KKS87359.1 MAG: hypothetical protein UV61_C0002G0080 [Candidatus Gottesmanbacteria bacterium GW2011_GWB1_43_11]OGG10027.1 MAG: hypothetical protein A2699_06505 [Candidatus Go
MKIWTYLTLFTVVAISAIGLGTIVKKNNSARVSPPPTITRTTPNTQETIRVDLKLAPETTSLHVGEETIYDVTIDSRDLGVVIVQGSFSFDPARLAILSIEPGPFLSQPDVLAKSVDPVAGKISYTLGSLKYGQGEGVVFRIKVKALTQTQGLVSPLSFEREKTKIGLKDQVKDIGFSVDQTVILFNEQLMTILS